MVERNQVINGVLFLNGEFIWGNFGLSYDQIAINCKVHELKNLRTKFKPSSL